MAGFYDDFDLDDNARDDDNGNEGGNLRRRRRGLPRLNYYDLLNDQQFKARFRLTKRGVRLLLDRIEHHLERPGGRNWRIPPMVQLLVVLRLFATGSFMIVIGDFLGISKTTVWRIIHHVAAVIASLRPEWIRFPTTPEEIRLSQAKFYTRASMPGVVGAIDGKLVRVDSFGGDNAEVYRGRKGFFAINVQAICNADLEFIDIVARWPGSAHDATIFNHSRIHANFEERMYGDALLVGDSGYPNSPYLLTPLRNPEEPEEVLYNESQIRTRNCIERTFGIWSKLFWILRGSQFRRVERTLNVIVAAAVLHNIHARTYPGWRRINVDVEAYNRIHDNLHLQMNADVRQQLIDNYFHDLVL